MTSLTFERETGDRLDGLALRTRSAESGVGGRSGHRANAAQDAILPAQARDRARATLPRHYGSH